MTRESYLRLVRKFGEHFGRCPSELGLEHAESFLLHLCREAGYLRLSTTYQTGTPDGRRSGSWQAGGLILA